MAAKNDHIQGSCRNLFQMLVICLHPVW
jgi:hypothetical protein